MNTLSIAIPFSCTEDEGKQTPYTTYGGELLNFVLHLQKNTMGNYLQLIMLVAWTNYMKIFCLARND